MQNWCWVYKRYITGADCTPVKIYLAQVQQQRAHGIGQGCVEHHNSFEILFSSNFTLHSLLWTFLFPPTYTLLVIFCLVWNLHFSCNPVSSYPWKANFQIYSWLLPNPWKVIATWHLPLLLWATAFHSVCICFDSGASFALHQQICTVKAQWGLWRQETQSILATSQRKWLYQQQ